MDAEKLNKILDEHKKWMRGKSGEASEWLELADLIESLQAQLAASQRRAQDARNELCLKCGRYKEAYIGACDGCRWKED